MIYLITESEFTQVLDGQDGQVTVHITPINADEIHKECDSLMVTSAIGDADTAAVVKAELRINVFANRTKPIKFTKGDVYYVDGLPADDCRRAPRHCLKGSRSATVR